MGKGYIIVQTRGHFSDDAYRRMRESWRELQEKVSELPELIMFDGDLDVVAVPVGMETRLVQLDAADVETLEGVLSRAAERLVPEGGQVDEQTD